MESESSFRRRIRAIVGEFEKLEDDLRSPSQDPEPDREGTSSMIVPGLDRAKEAAQRIHDLTRSLNDAILIASLADVQVKVEVHERHAQPMSPYIITSSSLRLKPGPDLP